MASTQDSNKKLSPAALGGILLMAAAVVAFAWANSPWQTSYLAIWEAVFTIGVGEFALSKPVILWVNDLLMAVFFLMVGLEIKREVMEGALSSVKKAALPVIAAFGGILVPSLIYAVINMSEGGASNGWAIPAATDIAFVLGILALMGSRVPISLKVFLTTVAVADDLGAVFIIAAFLTDTISMIALAVAAGVGVLLVICNRMKIHHPLPYIALGAVLWVAVLKSGVHATVAGVALAFFVPGQARIGIDALRSRVRSIFEHESDHESMELAPHTLIHEMKTGAQDAESPMHRWEHALQPWVLFFIMPVFALANAGVVLGGEGSGGLLTPVSLGVALGLLLGKPIGITLLSWAAVKSGFCRLPEGVTWKQIHAVSWLAGIGFTMSLFIAGLSVEGSALTAAKVGLLAGSLAAGIVGSALLFRATSAEEAELELATGEGAGASRTGSARVQAEYAFHEGK